MLECLKVNPYLNGIESPTLTEPMAFVLSNTLLNNSFDAYADYIMMFLIQNLTQLCNISTIYIDNKRGRLADMEMAIVMELVEVVAMVVEVVVEVVVKVVVDVEEEMEHTKVIPRIIQL